MRGPSDEDWAAVVARQPRDGVFAVRTTGIVCRFGCPARTPLRPNVRIFATREDAAAAGFRPCKRCWADVRKVQVSRVHTR
ncbi:MAG: hypothetical protein JXR75_04555 [Rhodobacteraceae bacterium]|nr:hypothetical protein [Paracoccaceae bacterium]